MFGGLSWLWKQFLKGLIASQRECAGSIDGAGKRRKNDAFVRFLREFESKNAASIRQAYPRSARIRRP